MEVIAAAWHVAFPMDEPSRVGEARRHAALLAQEAGLGEVEAGRLAIVVNELGNNLVRHARGGQLLLAAHPHTGEVEVAAIDKGPGIADLQRCMGDGYSTGGTPGTGLGAVRRLSRTFELHSAVPDGTVAVARVGAERPRADAEVFCAAGLSVPAPGERVCGDAWAVAFDGHRAAVLVADGLGHGPEAAKAAQAAVDVFVREPMADVAQQLERAHAALRTTRGAAVSLIQLDAQAQTLRCCGAGNVSARVVSGTSDRSVVTQHGTAGLQIRRPEPVTQPWPPHALLVVHSDGLETRWSPQRLLPVLQRDPVLAAGLLLRDHSRGRDDATVVVLRRGA